MLVPWKSTSGASDGCSRTSFTAAWREVQRKSPASNSWCRRMLGTCWTKQRCSLQRNPLAQPYTTACWHVSTVAYNISIQGSSETRFPLTYGSRMRVRVEFREKTTSSVKDGPNNQVCFSCSALSFRMNYVPVCVGILLREFIWYPYTHISMIYIYISIYLSIHLSISRSKI